METNKLGLPYAGKTPFLKRVARYSWGLMRHNPLIGKIEDFYRVKASKNRVSFVEEGDTIELLRFTEFTRSANLFDQREILVRSIVNVLIRNFLRRDGNIIDCGAQNGDTALIWAKMIKGTVYAIDPSRDNIEFISRTAKLNHIGNVEAICCALSDSIGILYPVSNINHSPFTTKPLHGYGKRNAVSCTTLDDMFSAGRIRNVELLHLDVEGMELRVLSSGREMIRRCSPIIIFEAHLSLDDVETMCDYLEKLNYFVGLINESTQGGRPDCVNFIAIPKNKNLNELCKSINNIIPRQEFFKTTYGPNLIEISRAVQANRLTIT